jgi:hypothetical protein
MLNKIKQKFSKFLIRISIQDSKIFINSKTLFWLFFKLEKKSYDIAMIKLGSPVVLNEHIIPVCIDELYLEWKAKMTVLSP